MCVHRYLANFPFRGLSLICDVCLDSNCHSCKDTGVDNHQGLFLKCDDVVSQNDAF